MKNANLYGGIELVKDKKLNGQSKPGEAGTNPPVTTPPVAAASASAYNSINNQIWGEGGSGYDAHMEQAQQEATKRQNDPTYGQAYTNEGLQQAAENAGISGDMFHYSQYATPDTYTGRPTKEGESGADESKLSDVEYEYVQYAKQMYNAAQTDEERAYWHNEAEKVRARYDYSGGADGSMYITNGEMGLSNNSSGRGGNGGYGSPQSFGPGYGASSGTGTSSDLQGYLDAWQQAALAQSSGQIDYAVQKAVADLQRALEDAQPQFKEMAEGVARDERQAMDNSALYAEMRGDNGGIGQAQYNSIQNTAAQNRLAVQQAQTKLATDTERQIADLRAQGEFEKADAALEITQTYLAQLISLEQWAAEYNLSVDQFNEQIRQWEMEYNMAMQQLQIGQSQWQQEFAFQQQQYQDSLALNQQSQKADIAWSLLQSGVELDADQLKALGISADQATSLLLQAQMKKNDSSNNSTTTKPVSEQSVYEWLYSENAKDYGTAYEALRDAGYNTTDANRYAKYYTETWLESQTPDTGTWSEGYSTQQNVGGVKASEWGYIRNTILQGLMSKNFAAVESYLDQVAAGFSQEQWLEIQALLDAYGFYSQQK